MIGISPEAYLSLTVVYVCRAPLGNDSSIRPDKPWTKVATLPT
jgi:hypothetical protein